METYKPYDVNTSDGCTLWPNGNWKQCCVMHDRLYYEGGSKAKRLKADIELMRCVASKGRPYMAIIMFLGVRIFGSPYWPGKMRWSRKDKYFKTQKYTK